MFQKKPIKPVRLSIPFNKSSSAAAGVKSLFPEKSLQKVGCVDSIKLQGLPAADKDTMCGFQFFLQISTKSSLAPVCPADISVGTIAIIFIIIVITTAFVIVIINIILIVIIVAAILVLAVTRGNNFS